MKNNREIIFNINRYYIENYKRDIISILAVAVIFTALYLFIFVSNSPLGLEVRKIALYVWVGLVAVYTILTSFKDYFRARRAYTSVLLPVSQFNKYFWEWFRTLILFGGVSFAVLFCVDYYMVDFFYYDRYLADFDSVKSIGGSLLSTVEPLNYLPVILYVIILVHSFILCGVVLFNRMIGIIIVGVLVVIVSSCIDIFVWQNYHITVSYPFLSFRVIWGNGLISSISWLTKTNEYLISYFLIFLLPISFILLSYNIFREKQAR